MGDGRKSEERRREKWKSAGEIAGVRGKRRKEEEMRAEER